MSDKICRMRRTTCFHAVLFVLAASCSNPEPPDDRPTCSYHSDCPNNGACYQGRCNPTASCLERSNCKTVPVCEGDRCICPEALHRCLPVCETDNDCSSEAICTDGVCKQMPVTFNGMPPDSGARGALKVGIGQVDLDFPMGVSMAGYASRQGPRTPY